MSASGGLSDMREESPPSHLLRRLAQLELLYLAGGGLGELGGDHVPRALVARGPPMAAVDKVVGRDFGAVGRLDKNGAILVGTRSP